MALGAFLSINSYDRIILNFSGNLRVFTIRLVHSALLQQYCSEDTCDLDNIMHLFIARVIITDMQKLCLCYGRYTHKIETYILWNKKFPKIPSHAVNNWTVYNKF
jgi:hypothetical protein